MGWENFLLGQVSLQWAHIQEQYLWSHSSCLSIKAWITLVSPVHLLPMQCGLAIMASSIIILS